MKEVFDYIKRNNLIEKHDNIILGISGGADSVCLLYILNGIREELGRYLYRETECKPMIIAVIQEV